MGVFQEGGFQIVERAAFSSRGNLLLQWNSYPKNYLRLFLTRESYFYFPRLFLKPLRKDTVK